MGPRGGAAGYSPDDAAPLTAAATDGKPRRLQLGATLIRGFAGGGDKPALEVYR
jgi:hypothetical protein